jgi:excisionase family DNA binding protein
MGSGDCLVTPGAILPIVSRVASKALGWRRSMATGGRPFQPPAPVSSAERRTDCELRGMNDWDDREPDPRLARSTIEDVIEAIVERVVERALRPYLHRLTTPEPSVYTAAQAASAMQVSEDTIWRMVKRGVLPRVPHIGGKVLIPRTAVDGLVKASAMHSQPTTAATRLKPVPAPNRSAAGP